MRLVILAHVQKRADCWQLFRELLCLQIVLIDFYFCPPYEHLSHQTPLSVIDPVNWLCFGSGDLSVSAL